MQILLFFFYVSITCLFFSIYQFDKKFQLSLKLICTLFVIKAIAGVVNQYIQNHQYVSNDSVYSFYQTMLELKAFKEQPLHMLHYWLFVWEDVFHHLNIFNQENTVYWSSLGRVLNDRYMLFSSILSFGHYYVNTVFYNLLFFIGQLFLFKTFYSLNHRNKWIYIVVIFLLPASLYWGTGMNKDGFVLTFIAFILYYTQQFFNTRKYKYIIFIAINLFLFLCIRNFYFLCFLPPYFLWLLFKSSKHPIAIYTVAYLCLAFIFMHSTIFISKINFLDIVVHKQQEFLNSKGYSDMQTPILDNNPNTFIKNFPTAISHGFFSPSFKLHDKLKYQLSAIDMWLSILLLLVFIIKAKFKEAKTLHIFIIFYALSMMLFIGYTIPNAGALLRYKSTFILLLLTSIASLSHLPTNNKFFNSLNKFFNEPSTSI